MQGKVSSELNQEAKRSGQEWCLKVNQKELQKSHGSGRTLLPRHSFPAPVQGFIWEKWRVS